jgi:hypothetical protein
MAYIKILYKGKVGLGNLNSMERNCTTVHPFPRVHKTYKAKKNHIPEVKSGFMRRRSMM